MRFLIAGAAGFVGSHLSAKLVRGGHRVLGLDNLSTGKAANVAMLRRLDGFRFVEHDVVSPYLANDGFDWILHLASPASPPKYLERPIETLRANSEGTINLLELARRTDAAFFLASTSEVYGDPLRHPQTEEYWGNVNPIGPRSVYDEGKRFAEALTQSYHRTAKVPVRMVRIFNTYGPRMDAQDGRVVSTFVRQGLNGEPLTAHGDGSQTRSLQYIDDLVDGIVRLLGVDYAGPVNLGNPEEMTILELAQLINRLTGNSAGIIFTEAMVDDPRQRCPNINLARRLLGWAPHVSVEEGLQRTIDYHRRQVSGVASSVPASVTPALAVRAVRRSARRT